MIEIKNVSKVYKTKDSEINALNNVNLRIGDGEIFGIIGASGAGKSSLVRCINKLEVPDSGQVFIDGSDITSLSQTKLRETRKKIGMIFQHFNLLMNKTVFDNVAFPLRISHLPKKQVEQQVQNILELVDLLDKKNSYPAQLSGGQKQRVGIARALANNPKIILSDEATSALDPTTTNSILELLKDINIRFNITIVVITHEMQVIKQICNKVAIIEEGAIVEEGSVIDIFTNPHSQTTRNFTKRINDIPKEYLNTGGNNGNEIIIRTLFIGRNSNQPVISTMIKKFDVDANILAGKIETIQDTNVGNLVLKITGNAENVSKAVEFLRENQVGIEVLS